MAAAEHRARSRSTSRAANYPRATSCSSSVVSSTGLAFCLTGKGMEMLEVMNGAVGRICRYSTGVSAGRTAAGCVDAVARRRAGWC